MLLLKRAPSLDELRSFLAAVQLPQRQSAPIHMEESQPVAPALLRLLGLMHNDTLLRLAGPLSTSYDKMQASADQIIDKLLPRMRRGVEEYGTFLHTHNSRDAKQDLEEEMLDGLQYAMQALMEAKSYPEVLDIQIIISDYMRLMNRMSKAMLDERNRQLVGAHPLEPMPSPYGDGEQT